MSLSRRSFLRCVGASSMLAIMPTFPYSNAPTLAAQIFNTTNTISDWNNSGSYGSLSNVGLIFNRSSNSDYDTWITHTSIKKDWVTVLRIKSLAEHSGYYSTTIDNAVRLALSQIPMLNHGLPAIDYDVTGAMWFHTFYKYTLYGFRYARELNWQTQRWHAETAFSYLAYAYDTFGRGFYWLNDDCPNGIYAESESYGTRWLEEGKILGCFLVFLELGIPEAKSYALKCWRRLNDEFWKDDHFTYSTGIPGYEFSSMDVFPDVFHLSQVQPGLPYVDRIFKDISNRYLSGWRFGQWSYYDTGITQHLTNDDGITPRNPELRMDGTLNAWIQLHSFYRLLDSNSRRQVNSMLQTASSNILSSTMLQSNGQFNLRQSVGNASKTSTLSNFPDDGTAQASLCLFLTGISVVAGDGLAIPLVSDFENDYSSINSNHFRFDYPNGEIHLPVRAGTTLRYAFGRRSTETSFQDTGIYSIKFNRDWSGVETQRLVRGLNSNEHYL